MYHQLNQTISKLSTEAKSNVGSLHAVVHKTVPEINCISKSCIWNESTEPNWGNSFLYPINIEIVPNDFNDMCCEKVKNYYDYNTKIKRLHSCYKLAKKKKHIRVGKKKGFHPSIALKFTEALYQHPDKYFSGKYNWFFTGGILSPVYAENKNNIAHISGETLNKLTISSFDENSCTLSKIAEKNFSDTIFEIQGFECFKDKFSTRCLNKISLHTIIDGNVSELCSLESPHTPFISSTISSQKISSLITSDLHQKVLIWDTNVSTHIPKQVLYNKPHKMMDQNWNNILYIDENITSFINFEGFGLLDSRLSMEANLKQIKNFNSIFACEMISGQCVSKFENIIYIGTSHKLFAFDLRCIRENGNLNESTYCRWSHYMNMSPSVIKSYKRENCEYILLGSQIHDDIRIFENTKMDTIKNRKKIDLSVQIMPYRPPSFAKSLQSAKMNNKCLYPVRNFEIHKRASLMGLSFLDVNDNLRLLNSNSIGDVFMQDFIFNINSRTESEISEYNNRIFNYWDSIAKEEINKPKSVNVTTIEKFEGFHKVFQCSTLDTVDEDDEIDIFDLTLSQKVRHNMVKLSKYKDVLATSLLTIWDTTMEDMDMSTIHLPKDAQPLNRVNEWLQSADHTSVEDEGII